MGCVDGPRSRQTQHGVALLEALVAFLLVSFSVMGSARLQSTWRVNADMARQRTEAVRLAQQEIERMRSSTDPAPEAPIPGGDPAVEAVFIHGSTSYALRREVGASTTAMLRPVTVSVSWVDRTGGAQQVALSTHVAQLPPVFSAVLSMVPHPLPSTGRVLAPAGVAAGIDAETDASEGVPPDLLAAQAHDLGAGRSVWKPPGHGPAAYLLDRSTGAVTSRCVVTKTAASARQLVVSELSACATAAGQLLQGYVRFSMGSNPDARHANDAPRPFEAELTLEPRNGAAPVCDVQLLKGVRFSAEGLSRREVVDASAAPAAVGATQWTEGTRFASYTCLVPMQGRSGWSGRLTLKPHGWLIGTEATAGKVCRYRAAAGAEGGPQDDAGRYSKVRTHLVEQNYLVVRGDRPCPHSAPPHNGASFDTVLHQP